MKYVWQDLEKPINAFTVRSATMRNLNTGKVVQHYAANTKIVLVQKCVTDTGTFYRTRGAEHHYLNYAFEASAFGLPDEIAPSAPSNTLSSRSKTKKHPKNKTSEDGETRRREGLFKRLWRMING